MIIPSNTKTVINNPKFERLLKGSMKSHIHEGKKNVNNSQKQMFYKNKLKALNQWQLTRPHSRQN